VLFFQCNSTKRHVNLRIYQTFRSIRENWPDKLNYDVEWIIYEKLIDSTKQTISVDPRVREGMVVSIWWWSGFHIRYNLSFFPTPKFIHIIIILILCSQRIDISFVMKVNIRWDEIKSSTSLLKNFRHFQTNFSWPKTNSPQMKSQSETFSKKYSKMTEKIEC
jgi:hypothetical protein